MSYLLQQPLLRQTPPYLVYRDLFDPEQCAALIELGKQGGMAPAGVGGDPSRARFDPEVRSTQVGWLPWQDSTDWIYARLAGICTDVRLNWYPFHLSGFGEPLQLGCYRAADKGHYGLHRDLGAEVISQRKLSMVVHLSDPSSFEGGVLRLPAIAGPDKNVHETEQGTAIVFPSWELHEVTQVTRGERWSLVAWVHGPPFS